MGKGEGGGETSLWGQEVLLVATGEDIYPRVRPVQMLKC